MSVQNISLTKPTTPQTPREATTKEKIVASIAALFAIAKSIQYDIYYATQQKDEAFTPQLLISAPSLPHLDADVIRAIIAQSRKETSAPIIEESSPAILLHSSTPLPQLLLEATPLLRKEIKAPIIEESSPTIQLPSSIPLPQLLLDATPSFRTPSIKPLEILTSRPSEILLQKRKKAAAVRELNNQAKMGLDLLASEIGKTNNESPMKIKTAKAWKKELAKYCTEDMQSQLYPQTFKAMQKARIIMGRMAKFHYSTPNTARAAFTVAVMKNAMRRIPR